MWFGEQMMNKYYYSGVDTSDLTGPDRGDSRWQQSESLLRPVSRLRGWLIECTSWASRISCAVGCSLERNDHARSRGYSTAQYMKRAALDV
jgi:hypothetical protein